MVCRIIDIANSWQEQGRVCERALWLAPDLQGATAQTEPYGLGSGSGR